MRNPGAHLGWSFAVCVSSPSPTKLGEQNFWTFVEHSKSKCLGSSSWVFPGPPLLPHNGQGPVWPLHQTQVTQQPRKSQQDIFTSDQPIADELLFSMKLSHSLQIDEDSLGLGKEQNEEKEKCETEEEGNIDLKQV